MKRFRVAYPWGDHRPGDVIEVDEVTARRLYRQGKGRILGDVVVKQVKKRSRKKAEPVIEPEGEPEVPTGVIEMSWQGEQSEAADESEV